METPAVRTARDPARRAGVSQPVASAPSSMRGARSSPGQCGEVGFPPRALQGGPCAGLEPLLWVTQRFWPGGELFRWHALYVIISLHPHCEVRMVSVTTDEDMEAQSNDLAGVTHQPKGPDLNRLV